MLYQRLVLAVIFTTIPEPLWRGILVALACVVNLVLAVRSQPFHVPRTQGFYQFTLALLVVLALLALPEMAKQSLSAQHQFGDNAANATALQWLQFVVLLIPGCVAVALLAMPRRTRAWFGRWSTKLGGDSTAAGHTELTILNTFEYGTDVPC